MVLGVALPLLTQIGQDLLTQDGSVIIGVFFIPLGTPLHSSRLVLYLALIIVYGACFLLASVGEGGLLATMTALVRGNLPKVPNWLVTMPLVASSLFLVVIFLTVLQDLAGVQTGRLPAETPSLTLYSLAYAPLLEEWLFRISPLGFVLGMRTLRSNGSLASFLTAFVNPEKAKAFAGLSQIHRDGWKGVDWTEWMGVGATAALFGLAHVIAGSGWETGKFATAALSGFILGLLFFTYGAYAAILLHWFFDFYQGVLYLSEAQIGGLLAQLSSFVLAATYLTGVLGLIVAAKMIVVRVEGPSASNNCL